MILIFLLTPPRFSFSAEKNWIFLPSHTLFSPLLADPREPQTGFKTMLKKNEYVGAIGKSFDLFQWRLSQKNHFGWGLTGAAFALLDYGGGSFPMIANDWQFGTYFSHINKKFSQRFEFTHFSAHLGDAISNTRKPIMFSREFLRWIFSYKQNDFLRYYSGVGILVHTIPKERKIFFFQGGIEFFSISIDFMSQPLRLYAGYDLKVKEEADGVVNNSLRFGIQWRPFRKQTGNAVQLGISYFNGNNEFGQFYREKDTHWELGIYFTL